MQNLTRHLSTLKILKRLPRSLNGNTRFLLLIDGYRVKTAVDSCLADYAKNYDGKQVVAVIGTHYGVLTLAELQLRRPIMAG